MIDVQMTNQIKQQKRFLNYDKSKSLSKAEIYRNLHETIIELESKLSKEMTIENLVKLAEHLKRAVEFYSNKNSKKDIRPNESRYKYELYNDKLTELLTNKEIVKLLIVNDSGNENNSPRTFSLPDKPKTHLSRKSFLSLNGLGLPGSLVKSKFDKSSTQNYSLFKNCKHILDEFYKNLAKVETLINEELDKQDQEFVNNFKSKIYNTPKTGNLRTPKKTFSIKKENKFRNSLTYTKSINNNNFSTNVHFSNDPLTSRKSNATFQFDHNLDETKSPNFRKRGSNPQEGHLLYSPVHKIKKSSYNKFKNIPEITDEYLNKIIHFCKFGFETAINQTIAVLIKLNEEKERLESIYSNQILELEQMEADFQDPMEKKTIFLMKENLHLDKERDFKELESKTLQEVKQIKVEHQIEEINNKSEVVLANEAYVKDISKYIYRIKTLK